MVYAIIGLALALRLVISIARPADRVALDALPDQREYLAIAENALSGHGFWFYDKNFEQPLYAYRMPGYPLFVAACGAKIVGVRVAQALIDTSTVIAVWLIARRYFERWPLWIAMGLVAFNPYLIYFSSLLLTETLFTAMLSWGTWALTRDRSRSRVGGVFMLTLSIFVRPSAMFLTPLLVAAVALSHGFDWRRTMLAAVGAAMLSVAVLFPWAFRNHRVIGAWIWSTTNDGFTLYDGLNPQADGSSNQGWFRELPELKTMSEVGRSRYLRGQATQYAADHPARVVSLAAAKLRRFWSPMPLSAEYGTSRANVVLGLSYALPFFALMLIGVSGPGLHSYRMFLVPALYFSVVHAIGVGSLRYRVPCDVPLAIIAGAGAAKLIYLFQKQRDGKR